MAERRPSAGSSALNQVDKNYKYGGDSAIGALLLPERREILQEEQNQFIGYDDRGQAIVQTLPAQYGESEVDFSYSPIVRGAKATGSFLNDIFFGDANEQSEAAGRAVSAVRGVVGGLGDYASSQYEAGMAGGTTYDPETRQITEFDPTIVMGGGSSGGGSALASGFRRSGGRQLPKYEGMRNATVQRLKDKGIMSESEFDRAERDSFEKTGNWDSMPEPKAVYTIEDSGSNSSYVTIKKPKNYAEEGMGDPDEYTIRFSDHSLPKQYSYDRNIYNVSEDYLDETINGKSLEDAIDYVDRLVPTDNYDPTDLYSGGGRQGSAIAGGSALRHLDINDLDEDQYIQAINPQGIRIAPEARPNLGMGDMYGMAPRNAEEIMTQELRSGDTVRYVQDGDSVYALGYNPDLGEEDVIGYMLGGGDGSELAVVDQMQGQGIGGNLSYLYRSQNPMAQSGGFTEAGEAAARQAYRRMMGYE